MRTFSRWRRGQLVQALAAFLGLMVIAVLVLWLPDWTVISLAFAALVVFRIIDRLARRLYHAKASQAQPAAYSATSRDQM